jgi:hypothetical protein
VNRDAANEAAESRRRMLGSGRGWDDGVGCSG